MKKGWIIALISVGAVAGAYLYYRSQKKAKPLITIPALAPTVTPTPSWLEALKGLASPTPTVTEAVSVAPAYVAPAPTYEAPAPSYEAPTPTYKAPTPSYVAPAPAVTQPGEYWSEGVRYTPSIDPVTGLPFAI